MPQWQRDYLVANCIFVNLEHRLYRPDPVIPDMFNPPPPPPGSPQRIAWEDKGKEAMVYLDDLLAPGQMY